MTKKKRVELKVEREKQERKMKLRDHVTKKKQETERKKTEVIECKKGIESRVKIVNGNKVEEKAAILNDTIRKMNVW